MRSVGFRRPHLRRGLRQQIGDLLEALVLIDLTALHLLDQLVDLRLQLALRQREEHHVLAVLLRRELRLVANHVEGRGDDLFLLLRQLADVVAAATAAAALWACDCAGLKSFRYGRICTK